MSTTGNAISRRSKLAVAALLLSPSFLIATLALCGYWLNTEWNSGWEGLEQLIGFAIAVYAVFIGGSVLALLSLILAFFARRKIRRNPQQLTGLPQARLASLIAITSLVAIWVTALTAIEIHARPKRAELAAEREIAIAYSSVADHAREKGAFPDGLEDVVPSETARRYTYLGRGLPARLAGSGTPDAQSIVVMYSNGTVRGMYAAVCANGMTHSWPEMILREALKESGKLRKGL